MPRKRGSSLDGKGGTHIYKERGPPREKGKFQITRGGLQRRKKTSKIPINEKDRDFEHGAGKEFSHLACERG